MTSFTWPSVFVLKGSKIVVDRTILKCSWDASVLERLGSEYSSKLVSKIVISSNERMVEPAPLDAPKSATQIMLGTRNAELNNCG